MQFIYIVIFVPILLNMLSSGMQIWLLSQSLREEIRELRGDLRVVSGKMYDLDARVSRIEDKLGISPQT